MTVPLTLAIFGATGGTGRQLLEQALTAGHRVRALARRPEALGVEHPHLTVLAGDAVRQPDSLTAVIAGSDVVLSALGSHSGRKPTDIYSVGTRNIAAAMINVQVRRLLVISAQPVSPPAEKDSFSRLIMHPLLHQFFGGSYADVRRMEVQLSARTDLDWTIFRPPYLADGPATGTVRTAVGSTPPRAQKIRRADLAAAMLAAIGDRSTHGVAINIAE